MTGSLQTKNGKFYMVITYVDSNGKRKNKWISTKLSVKGNKKAAQAMLAQWFHDHKNCNMKYSGSSFVEYLEAWLDFVRENLKPSTVRGYGGNLKNHIIPYFRNLNTKLTELRAFDLELFYSSLSKKGLSKQSVLHCHRIISKALNDAVNRDILVSSPASSIKKTAPRFVGSFLNMGQLQEMVTLFREETIYPVISFLATYGMRRGEALGLCWDKVDFENNQFTICRSLIQVTGEDVLQESTKNESSYRTLPMTEKIREMFLSLKEREEKNRALFGDRYQNSRGLVFVWEDGSYISPNYLSKRFHRLLSASTLPMIRLHDIRHSVASNLLARGHSVMEVQALLGHSLPSTTLNHYCHTDSSSKKGICNTLEDGGF